MQFSAVVLALAFGSASAFMGARVAPRAAKTSAISMTTQEELAELAESNRDALGAGLGFWDPLGCSKSELGRPAGASRPLLTSPLPPRSVVLDSLQRGDHRLPPPR